MTELLRYTLLAEGPSDKALMAILDWLLGQHLSRPIVSEWADPAQLRTYRRELRERVSECIRLWPCDLLFVHRDADSRAPENRWREILDAAGPLPSEHTTQLVPVVPVQALETWLLVDEEAIRSAAGRPQGRDPLGIPRVGELGRRAHPKRLLEEALRIAAGEAGGRRRRRKFGRLAGKQVRIAGIVADWSPLRRLPSFQRLEHALVRALREWLMR